MKQLVQLLLVLCLGMAPVMVRAQTCPAPDWPLWDAFKAHFIDSSSGRVIDASTSDDRSTSEGQSYGMLFAVLANDPDAFEQMWSWSVNNLGEGDLTKRLPAWIWGQAKSGDWTVIDDNSASDADLWFAYALLEAGRLWNRPDYTEAAHALLDLIVEHEVAELPGLGVMLLPGREGFQLSESSWRLNPSYLPIPLLRRLQYQFPEGPWADMVQNVVKMIQAVTPHKVAPDWTIYDASQAGKKGGFTADTETRSSGSYDAIRVYLWAGMTAKADPQFETMLNAVVGLEELTRKPGRGLPPESVDTQTGRATGVGPFGFSAALLPYLGSREALGLQRFQSDRVNAWLRYGLLPENTDTKQPNYYDFVLALFGLGWLENRYRFDHEGKLELPWERKCRDVISK